MSVSKYIIHSFLALLLLATLSAPIRAQSNSSAPTDSLGYNLPPDKILSVMRAPSPPVPLVSPTYGTVLLVSWQDYPSITRVAQPFLRLAGARVEPKNHSKHDTPGGYGITPCAAGFALVRVSDRKQTPVSLPAGLCPGTPIWSADGERFAFANIAPDSVQLWIGDAANGNVQQVPTVHLNPMFNEVMQWMPDQKTLLVKLVPQSNQAPPQELNVLSGPSIQETTGQKGQSSTYEARDTLSTARDEDLFDYFALSQLAFVDSTTLSVTSFGKPANYDHLNPAPDGHHILVTTIHKPYSYVVTYSRFPKEVEVWDTSSPANISVHTVASLPLADRVPIHGVPTGPRNFSWRATEPATLFWAEALDGGDWNVNVPHRDKILIQKAPFTSPATEITQTEQRYEGFDWSEQPSVALLHEYDENRHWIRTFIMDVDNLQSKPQLLWDLSEDEHYQDPGDPVYRQLPNGTWVMRQHGDSIFLSGFGSSPEGDRPFLDQLNLKTLKTERLFRSDKDCYERFLSFAGPGDKTFLTWHQSPTDPPNAFTRSLGSSKNAPDGEAIFASTSVPLTHIPDPTPEVRAIKKRLVTYKRADGLDLSFTLYTPPGYQEGTRVPTILYAYPLDYAQASTAAQVTGSQETFTRLRQYRLLLLAGYSIIDNAAFPIIGDPKKAYDTYLEQLVADAKAAVDEGVRLGVVDPNRVGVTGHSHGALMTVNLVAKRSRPSVSKTSVAPFGKPPTSTSKSPHFSPRIK